MQDNNKATRRVLRDRRLVLVIVFVVLVIAGGAVAVRLFELKNQDNAPDVPTFRAQRGPLQINITEAGTIKARQQEIIKNEVEGRTTILSLIPEGTEVKKGDLLIELDSSKLLDTRIDQQIQVENAEAAFIRARENLAVVENQAQSDVDKAELTLEFAKLDLKKYLEGEYPNQLTEAKARINLAEEELNRAEETLDWSRRLYDDKYISLTQYQADELARNKNKLDLELAKNNLKLLQEFTYGRTIAELESDVKQAEMALERTTRKASADVIQAKAELRAKESELGRQKDKLAKIEVQIAKTKMYAPADGLAIYATSVRGNWRGDEAPLDEGQEVYERQELIHLPTASEVKAEIKIHESNLEKINIGLPAMVTVDAVPGKVFYGKVTKIAPLPDPTSVWMNPDLKVYDAEIYIEGDGSILRTGMSCMAQIVVKEYEDTVYVPVQAVVRVDGKPTVYVRKELKASFEPCQVEVDMDNSRMIRIVSGLSEGQEVLLTPPLADAEVKEYAGAKRLQEGREMDEQRAGSPAREDKPAGEKELQGPVMDRERQQMPRPGRRQQEQAGQEGTNLSEEQIRNMRDRFEKMSAEEREKMRQEWLQRQQQQPQQQGQEQK